MTGKSEETDSNRKGLPEYLRPFFWDVDLQKLSMKDSSYFIISRLMEHGDEKAVIFLLQNYGRKEMIDVLKNSRSLYSITSLVSEAN